MISRVAFVSVAFALVACSSQTSNPFRHGVNHEPLKGKYAIAPSVSGNETLADLGSESSRVLISPSFGRFIYYVSLRRQPIGCLPPDRRKSDGSDNRRACGPGHMHVRRMDQVTKSVAEARFYLPVEETDRVLGELDASLSRWTGENFGGTDGTRVSLERNRGGAVTSMSSNAYASRYSGNPAAQLSADLLRLLLAFGPAGFAPRSFDWDVRPADEGEDVCNRPGIAEPLDHGFGEGNSDCSGSQRWPQ